MLLCILPTKGHASNEEPTLKETHYLKDGSYMIVTTHFMETRAASTKVASRACEYYNSNDIKQWKLTLTAKFTYNGIVANCTSASCYVTIYDSAWTEKSSYATYSSNYARATTTMAHKYLGVTTQEINRSVTLTCTPDGNIY